MYPIQHIFLGAIFSLLIFMMFPQINLIGLSLIFLSTFLIDVDHYIYFCCKKKNINLKKSYKYFIDNIQKTKALPKEQRKKTHQGFYFLHGIEFLIILLLLSYVSPSFIFIFIGVAFHLVLDIISISIFLNRIDRVSIIYDFLKYKKLVPLE